MSSCPWQRRLSWDHTCLVCMQFAGYVLEKLPYMKDLASDVFERKMRHLALLGTLLNLYSGPAMLKLDSTRAGGLTFLSKRTNVPVRSSSSIKGRAGQGRAGQGRAGQGRAGQGRAGQGTAMQ